MFRGATTSRENAQRYGLWIDEGHGVNGLVRVGLAGLAWPSDLRNRPIPSAAAVARVGRRSLQDVLIPGCRPVRSDHVPGPNSGDSFQSLDGSTRTLEVDLGIPLSTNRSITRADN